MNRTQYLQLPLIAAMIVIGVAASTAFAAESATDAQSETELNPTREAPHSAVNLPSGLGDFCFFAHLPPANQKYKIIKNLQIGKGTYGGVADILPKMAEYAQMRGADAIVEYSGSQRFGFWPWRLVRPVVRGVAVQWTEPKPADCESVGGTKLSTILSSGQPPAQ